MKNKEARSIFSSLENFTSPPPPELWKKIEAELDQPKKKKRPVIWWWVAAGLIAGLSIPTMWYVSSNQGTPQELNIENNTNEVVLQKDSKFNGNDTGNVNDNKSNVVESSSSDQKNNNVIAVAEEKLNTK